MQICDGRQNCPNEIGSIGLVIAAFATNAIEKFSAKSQVCHEIY
jgi:hypothetical protein